MKAMWIVIAVLVVVPVRFTVSRNVRKLRMLVFAIAIFYAVEQAARKARRRGGGSGGVAATYHAGGRSANAHRG